MNTLIDPQSFQTIMPVEIPIQDVQYNFMVGMQKIHDRSCVVDFIEEVEDGNLFLIKAESANDFYKLGFIGYAMIKQIME